MEVEMNETITGGEYLARLLRTLGVTHLFQQEVSLRLTTRVGETMNLQDILTHSEAAAAYMADGYSRATGRVGVCSAQSVGAANLAAGLADAWFAGTPVLAITGKKSPELMERNAYQELSHPQIFSAVTKYHAECLLPIQFPHLLRQCLCHAAAGKPGPVHLDFQGLTGEQTESAQQLSTLEMDSEFGSVPPFRPAADENSVAEGLRLLFEAKKPVIIAGRGVIVSGAKLELVQFADLLDAPVLTTPDGKTALDEENSRWCGIVGAYGMLCANEIASQSDLVVYVGSQASDQTTNNWTTPAPGVPVIHIDIDPTQVGRNYPGTAKLVGDAKKVLQQLCTGLTKQMHREWMAAAGELLQKTISVQEFNTPYNEMPIDPKQLCRELSAALPDDAVLVSDTGYSAIWTSTMVRMKQSQSYLRAAGTLGWAFPAALGVKCGLPDRPVYCFTGDGGFYYHLQEMETARRYGIRTITVLNNNGMLMQDAPTMKYTYPDNPQAGIAKIKFSPVNFSAIAREFGLAAIRVEAPEELAPAFARAAEAEGPVLIEVITNPDGPGPMPPVEGLDVIGEK